MKTRRHRSRHGSLRLAPHLRGQHSRRPDQRRLLGCELLEDRRLLAGLTINDVTMPEGSGGGTTPYEFTVTLDMPDVVPVSVDYFTDDGTAGDELSEGDYISQSGTLTFMPGETVQTVTIDVVADDKVEGDEIFAVKLSNAVGAKINNVAGIGTIQNDDAATISIDDVTMFEGHTPDTTIYTFTVTLDKEVDTSVSVDYATADDTAQDELGDGDYLAAGGTLNFAGMAAETQTIEVTVVGDDVVELDETFFVNLSNVMAGGRDVAIAGGQGVGTILNDDGVAISIDDVMMLEGDAGTSPFMFTITMSAPVAETVTVDANTAGITAHVGDGDYIGEVSQTITFNPGETMATLIVDIFGDEKVELDETFMVVLSNLQAGANAANVMIVDDTGVGTILNDDSAALTIDDVTMVEGDTPDTTIFTFTVTLDSEVDTAVSVDYATADDTAEDELGGNDYTSTGGTLNFAGTAGDMQTIEVTVVGDDDVELDETFFVNLFNLMAGGRDVTIADDQGLGTILDDDGVAISIDDVMMLEGDAGIGQFIFTISLSAAVNDIVTVDASTMDGTAMVADGDYNAVVNNTVIFYPGELSVTMIVEKNGDEKVELDETFFVVLSNLQAGANPDNVTIVDDTGVGTILNDDAATLGIDDVTMVEGNTPDTTIYTFTVTLDSEVDTAVSVDYTTADDTAQDELGDGDYMSTAGTLNFVGTAGETQTIEVTVVGDDKVELDETFLVNLSNLMAGGRDVTPADDQGLGTILNDDAATLSIDDVTMAEGNTPDTTIFTFTVTLSSEIDAGVDVDFVTSDDTAQDELGDGDYLFNFGTLNFAGTAGEMQTIDVSVVGDDKVELDETFFVDLFSLVANGRDVSIADGQGVGTILNDDMAMISIDDVTMVEGNTPDVTIFTFTVSLDNEVDTSVDVDFITTDGTAEDELGDNDYLFNFGTLTFAGTAGETQTVDVTVNGDDVVELDEMFFLDLFNLLPAGRDVSLANLFGTGTILNDDAASLAIDDVMMAEGNTPDVTIFTFTVTLTGGVDTSFTVDYATADNTAQDELGDGDYLSAMGTLTFSGDSGESRTIEVIVVGDDKVELDETFFVNLFNLVVPDGRNVTIADDQGVGTIENDDAATLMINDVTMAEGDTPDTTIFSFIVFLDGQVDTAVDVDYATADGTAQDELGDGDYTSTAGTLNFLGTAGEVMMIEVPVIGDLKVELDETFLVDLLGITAGGRDVTFADNQGLGTIFNDDLAAISIDDVTMLEGDAGSSQIMFTVSMSNPVDGIVTVQADTIDGSAMFADGDYNSLVGEIITFNPGETMMTLIVEKNGDEKVELDELFSVVLSNLQAGVHAANVLLLDDTGVGTIENDDAATITIDDVSMAEGNSPDMTIFTFTVTLDSEVDTTVDVDYATSDGTAQDGLGDGDYVATAGMLNFTGTAGEMLTIDVTVVGDDKVELDETFFVDLLGIIAGGRDVTFADNQGMGTILNDDAATITIDDVMMAEGNTPGTTMFTFTVTLSGEVDTGVDVDYATSDGTAQDGLGDGDYMATGGTLNFAGMDGETQLIDVTVVGDDKVELDETFFVDLLGVMAGGRDVTIAGTQGLGTILNDDEASLAIDDVTMAEGNAPGTTIFSFTVTLTGEVDMGLSVDFATADDTAQDALGDGDYQATGGTLNFAGMDGETQTIDVTVVGDDTVELDETFFVNLSNLVSAVGDVGLADDQGLGTILNDDVATISIDDVSMVEGDAGTSQLMFTLSLSNPVDGVVTVNADTADGTATVADGDYSAVAAQTITFNPGDTTATLLVTNNGDTKVELDETLSVMLSGLDPGAHAASVSIGDDTGVGTILNDDEAAITIDDVSVLEGNAGTTQFIFTISMSGPVDTTVTVDANTADGTATAGDSDYNSIVAQTVTFNPGDTTATLTVEVNGDLKVELDETFSVVLSNLQAGGRDVSITGGTGVGTILNDDSATVSINDVSLNEGDAGLTAFTFTISMTNPADVPVTVQVNTADGTATLANNDYNAVVGQTVTINPGNTSASLTVNVNGDLTVELDETFDVNVSGLNAQGRDVALSDTSGLGTILNDDDDPMTATLSGSVYNDTNNDGVRDPGEAGLPGVIITLTGTTLVGDTVNLSTTTAGDGSYSFGNLAVGEYALAESQPAAFYDGIDTIGTQGGTVGDDAFTDIMLAPAQAGTGNNFGEMGMRSTFISKRLFLASTPPDEEVLREIIEGPTQTTDNGDQTEQTDDNGDTATTGEGVAASFPPDYARPAAVPQVTQVNRTLTVTGTPADDVFEFIAGTVEHTIVVNQQSRRVRAAEVTRVTFDGAAGRDRTVITGSAAGDVATVRPKAATLESPAYFVSTTSSEDILLSGGAGADRATIFDSIGDDTLQVGRTGARLVSGEGISSIDDFELVRGVSDGGGHDTLELDELIDFAFEQEGDWHDPLG